MGWRDATGSTSNRRRRNDWRQSHGLPTRRRTMRSPSDPRTKYVAAATRRKRHRVASRRRSLRRRWRHRRAEAAATADSAA